MQHVRLLACREVMLVELNVLSYDALAQAGNPEEESAMLVFFAGSHSNVDGRFPTGDGFVTHGLFMPK